MASVRLEGVDKTYPNGRRLDATMVYVTHVQEEAMTLGQRVADLADGALQQVAGAARAESGPRRRRR